MYFHKPSFLHLATRVNLVFSRSSDRSSCCTVFGLSFCSIGKLDTNKINVAVCQDRCVLPKLVCQKIFFVCLVAWLLPCVCVLHGCVVCLFVCFVVLFVCLIVPSARNAQLNNEPGLAFCYGQWNQDLPLVSIDVTFHVSIEQWTRTCLWLWTMKPWLLVLVHLLLRSNVT